MAERLPVEEKVAGSNPVYHPIIMNKFLSKHKWFVISLLILLYPGWLFLSKGEGLLATYAFARIFVNAILLVIILSPFVLLIKLVKNLLTKK